jgi:hypothetical protein
MTGSRHIVFFAEKFDFIDFIAFGDGFGEITGPERSALDEKVSRGHNTRGIDPASKLW